MFTDNKIQGVCVLGKTRMTTGGLPKTVTRIFHKKTAEMIPQIYEKGQNICKKIFKRSDKSFTIR